MFIMFFINYGNFKVFCSFTFSLRVIKIIRFRSLIYELKSIALVHTLVFTMDGLCTETPLEAIITFQAFRWFLPPDVI